MDALQIEKLIAADSAKAVLAMLVPGLIAIVIYLFRLNQNLWQALTDLQAARLKALDQFLLEGKRDPKN